MMCDGNDAGQAVFQITDSQRYMLENSEEDINCGELISDDELCAEEDQWLQSR